MVSGRQRRSRSCVLLLLAHNAVLRAVGALILGGRNVGTSKGTRFPAGSGVPQLQRVLGRPAFATATPHDDMTPVSPEKPMEGCVCVVTGSSRGIGKGIALELGEAGATVYVTGTSSLSPSNNKSVSPYGANTASENTEPGTIEQTAREVTEAGGVGIPFYCDHSDDDQVRNLFAQIQADHGRLDLLVNNAFRIPPGGTKVLMGKFWETGIDSWDFIHTVGLRSHYVASSCAVPVMLQNPTRMGSVKQPLIVMVSSFGALTYTFNVAYGVGKAGVDRMAKDMAVELRPHGIATLSVWPGVVMTERTQVMVQTGEWDREVGIPLENAESPRLTGRVIVALATSDTVLSKSGGFQVVAEAAKELGIRDVDGKQPPSIRSFKFLLPAYAMDEQTRRRVPDWLIPDWKLPFWIMAGGQPPDRA